MSQVTENIVAENSFNNSIRGLENATTATATKKTSTATTPPLSDLVVDLGEILTPSSTAPTTPVQKKVQEEKKIEDFHVFMTYAHKGEMAANRTLKKQVRQIAKTPGNHQALAKNLIKWSEVLKVPARIITPANKKFGMQKENLLQTFRRFLQAMKGSEHIQLWDELVDDAVLIGHVSRSTERELTRLGHMFQLEYINR